jgi:hypothetical protein
MVVVEFVVSHFIDSQDPNQSLFCFMRWLGVTDLLRLLMFDQKLYFEMCSYFQLEDNGGFSAP